MCQLAKSAFIALFIFTPILLFSHEDSPHSMNGHSKADMLDQCVEPTEIMQKEHFVFLYHQRDKTVIDGVRTKNHSLANCVDCHVSYDEQGKAFPINAEGQFCQECHVKTATNITCFSCHAAEPRFPQHSSAASKIDLNNINELVKHIENDK